MKGMAIPAVPRYDDRSVCSKMWEGGGVESGDDNDFTSGAALVLEVLRRRQGEVVLELPHSRQIYQMQAPSQGQQFSGEVLWENRGCGKNVTGVGKM